MSYATMPLMIARFGEREIIALTDTEQPFTGQINAEKLAASMDMANSEIDGYLSTRYAVPVQTPPAFLVGIACDLARYHAAVGCARVTERDEVRYKAAVKSLENIAAGKLGVGITPNGGNPAAASAQDVVMTNRRSNDFGNGGW
jgi:phage gp36-like protein